MFEICRLCLRTFESPNANIITDDVLRQIQTILPEVNLNIVTEPTICQICLESLQKAYNFKMACLLTEKSLTELTVNSPGLLKIGDLLNIKKDPEEFITADVRVEVAVFDKERTNLTNKPKEAVKDKDGYVCSSCDRCFTYEQFFQAHWKKHGDEDLKCEYCDKSFVKTESVNLSKHITSSHFQSGVKCTLCPIVFHSQWALKKHIENHERRFKCDTCGLLFEKEITLNEHLQTHSNEKCYQCSICSKSYTEQSILEVHIKSMHSDERPFKCDECGKSYKLKPNYKQHMLTHSKEKPRYSCSHCGKGYWVRNKLEIHERYHTRDRPQICHVCSKCFPDDSSLKQHLSTHSDLKPHSCELCGKRFNRKGNLEIHMATHKSA